MSDPTTPTPRIVSRNIATPYSLGERKRHGQPPRGELVVQVPRGKSVKDVFIEVDLEQCLYLCSAFAEAALLLSRSSNV